MNVPDIIYELICYSDIQTASRIARTCHLWYNIFNENRIWVHYIQQLINYNDIHYVWIINEKETYKRCINISKLIKSFKYFLRI